MGFLGFGNSARGGVFAAPRIIDEGSTLLDLEALITHSGFDGQLVQLASTGALFVFNTAMGRAIRPEIHAFGTLSKAGQIDGLIAPSAESPAWAHTITGTGAINANQDLESDSHAWVQFNGSAQAGDNAYATLTFTGNPTEAYLAGWVRWTAVGTSFLQLWGTSQAFLGDNGGNYELQNGGRSTDVALIGAKHYIEMFVRSGPAIADDFAMAWIDGSPGVVTMDHVLTTAGGVEKCQLGDSTGDTNNIWVRDVIIAQNA